MALYTSDSRDRVRDAIDMVDLVSSRTELRRAGVNRMTGLCPFHDERTPSFGINPVEKVYYCFGCQASGDAFTFVMETEGVDFKGALELLADRFNVALELQEEDPQAAEKRKRRERLLELLERTATFYVRQLWESGEAERARAYLAERGLDEATLREFRVGYAPSAWDTVLKASLRAGFKATELYDAGLSQGNERSGRKYDRFRSQIMFPLADPRGRVRGFAGRTLGDADDRRPKYVNSPEGDLFHKRSQLFGADLARGAAAKAGFVVAAEGYTDVIALHQIGLRNCVGIMGTALTDDQIDGLARLAPEVRLALDADSAGKEAMLRAARVALGRSVPLRLRVVALPAGEDPADVVRRGGGDEIRERVEQSVPFVRFRVLQTLDTGDLSDAEGRDRVGRQLTEVFSLLGPSAEREELRRIAADRLDLSPELLERVLPQGSGSAGPAGGSNARGGVAATDPGRRPPARGQWRRARAPRADGAVVPGALHRAAGARCAGARRARPRRRPHERVHPARGRAPARAPRRADDRPRRRRSAARVHARAGRRRCPRRYADGGHIRDRTPAADARAAGPRDRGRTHRGERRHLRAGASALGGPGPVVACRRAGDGRIDDAANLICFGEPARSTDVIATIDEGRWVTDCHAGGERC